MSLYVTTKAGPAALEMAVKAAKFGVPLATGLGSWAYHKMRGYVLPHTNREDFNDPDVWENARVRNAIDRAAQEEEMLATATHFEPLPPPPSYTSSSSSFYSSSSSSVEPREFGNVDDNTRAPVESPFSSDAVREYVSMANGRPSWLRRLFYRRRRPRYNKGRKKSHIKIT